MPDPISALIPIGANLIGGYAKAKSAGKAADRISQGYNAAAEAAKQALGPYAQLGLPAAERLQAGIAPGGEFAKPFSMADAMNSQAMKTALEQGRSAIEGSAAAKGGLLSTNTLTGLTDYGQRVGAQYQQQAFNQWLAERGAMMDPLYKMLGVGAGAAGDIAGAQGSAAIGSAQARGSADIARGNAFSNFMSQVGAPSSPLGSAVGSLFSPSGGGGGMVGPGIGGSSGSIGADYSLTGGGGYSPYGFSGMSIPKPSDERLKTDIRRVGKTDDGHNIYTYRMKAGGPTEMGVMAQELEHSRPQAVSMHHSGYRMVDYDMVH